MNEQSGCSKWSRNFRSFREKREKVIPRKVSPFFPKIFHWVGGGGGGGGRGVEGTFHKWKALPVSTGFIFAVISSLLVVSIFPQTKKRVLRMSQCSPPFPVLSFRASNQTLLF